MSEVSQAVLKDLVPTGTLRAAINYGNSVLVQRNAATGELAGVSPELAREVARRLGVPIELIPYDGAGKVVEAAKSGAWDIAFLAIDPKRGKEILFTSAYVHIEGSYVVRKDSALSSPTDVDQPGVKVSVGTDSAYDLFLTRTLKNASLVRKDDASEVYTSLENGEVDAGGGVRQMIQRTLASHPGLKLVSPNFMTIEQAMGTPVGREAGREWLVSFIEEMKASGFVADALKRTGQTDASVAPPAAG